MTARRSSRARVPPRTATRPPARRFAARAHAKVNLDLRVLGARPDGYHELRTVFQTIELHDTLTAVDRPGDFVLQCRTPGVPLDSSNLVWRAGAALWTALGRPGSPRDTVVQIDKAIPMESGLGGGSADAAAGLQVLARVWGGAPLSLLREVAAGVGSDVPFFLSGGTALGLGRGEEIYPLVDLPQHWVVIVRPPFGVSTAEAYAWYDEDRAAGVREPRGELQVLPVPWPTRAAQMINDLEPPVVRRHPEIASIKAALKEAGAVAAAMSGSGSAVFGLFRTRPSAARAVGPLGRSGARAVLTRTLSRAEHERRARPVARRV
jgi:4-diphosphocytidyl-2-C-methyl-D-erythritol kinase